MPVGALGIAAVFILGFRTGLNVIGSNVIDVGYASVIGADRVGEGIYGNFPVDNARGDTYGPVLYYAYVPFEALLPWSGTGTTSLPHAAASPRLLPRRLGYRRLRGPPRRLPLRLGDVPFPLLVATQRRRLVGARHRRMLALLAPRCALRWSRGPRDEVRSARSGRFATYAPAAAALILTAGGSRSGPPSLAHRPRRDAWARSMTASRFQADRGPPSRLCPTTSLPRRRARGHARPGVVVAFVPAPAPRERRGWARRR